MLIETDYGDQSAPKVPAPVMRLINVVCERHDIPLAEIWTEFFDREVVDCRSEIIWRLRHGKSGGIKPITVMQLSKWFGKSRATIMSCMKRHARLRVLAQRGSFS